MASKIDTTKYVAQVRKQLEQLDKDSPEEFGIEQTCMLTGNAYYVAKWDTCWLELKIKFGDGTKIEDGVWAAIVPDGTYRYQMMAYYELTLTPPGTTLKELNDGWYN